MKNPIVILITIFYLFMSSCSNNEQKEQRAVDKPASRETNLKRIKNLEAEMKKSNDLSTATAGLAIKAYTDFVLIFPDDSLSPDFLFKAGQIATVTKQYPQALSYYKNITDKYPAFKYKQESLYLQGFILDNYVNDDAKAKIIYEEVISKYPGSTYANDAKAAINNLGKSDEELIKEFKKKNGQK